MQLFSNLIRKPFSPFLFLSFFLLLILSSCSSQKTIVHNIDESEANEITVFLSSKGIDGIKVQSTDSGGTGANKVVLWNINVDASQYTEAMALLNQAGLPRRRGQNLLGIFSDVGLVPSELQQKIRYQAGLAEQIASTIRKIDGVLDAEVQISFPEEDPLNPTANKQKITASVYVKHSGVLDDPNTHLATKIRRLVSASITGLNFDDVTIISDRARFNELPSGTVAEEKNFVRIWSLFLAEESVTRFRVIFFSFLILLILLLSALIWVGYKLYPLLQAHGGVKQLLTFKQIEPEIKEESEASSKIEEEKGEEDHKGMDET